MNPFIADPEAEQAGAIMVALPWPDSRLSPNARLHWRAKAQAVKQARWDASYAVLSAANGSLHEWRRTVADQTRIPIKIWFYPPDARHRDDDNMVGSFKHYRDGIADALGVNDRRFAAEYYFATPEKPGRVEVTVG